MPSPRGSHVESPLVYGIHPVVEILERRPADVERVFVVRAGPSRLGRALRLARQAGIPVSQVPRGLLARMVGPGASHQGLVARVAAKAYAPLDELCRAAAARDDGWLVLVDRVTDPRNLGAILRTSAAAGVDGVILAGDRTAGLTPAAMKTAAGAAELLPVARDPRPTRSMRRMREAGFRGVLLDPRGTTPWSEVDLRSRCVILAGGEERGVRPALARDADVRARIPLAAGVQSLNVAISLGVLLFEAVRQRGGRS